MSSRTNYHKNGVLASEEESIYGRSNIKLLLVILDDAKERAYPHAPYFRNGLSPLVSSPIGYCSVFDL